MDVSCNHWSGWDENGGRGGGRVKLWTAFLGKPPSPCVPALPPTPPCLATFPILGPGAGGVDIWLSTL